MACTDASLLELAQEALPLVSRVAVQIGQDTKDRRFGSLSGLLTFVLITIDTLSTLPLRQAEIYETKIKAILQLLEKACTWPKTVSQTWRHLAEYPTLQSIANNKETQQYGGKSKLPNIHRGLREFFSGKYKRESESLLAILEEMKTIQDLTADDMGLGGEEHKNNTPGYPCHVNQTLFFTLSEHTSCNCKVQHLKSARLRLDSIEDHEGENVLFEFEFPASSSPYQSHPSQTKAWHGAMMVVRKRIGRKRISKATRRSPSPKDPVCKELSPGDLCKYLETKTTICLKFNLALEDSYPILKASKGAPMPFRKVKMVQSLSLTEFLQLFRNKMSKFEKFQLAHILAKSIWQYYGSDWMRNPWTYEDIQFLEVQQTSGKLEKGILASYCPYLAPDFKTSENHIGEYHSEGLLIHRYPGVLALAVMLIDIMAGHLLPEFQGDQPYNYRKIRECYTLASIAKDNLDCDVLYKQAIEKCLDRRLFDSENAQFNQKEPQQGLEIRQSIIYKEIVAPLKYLLKILSAASEQTATGPGEQHLYQETATPSQTNTKTDYSYKISRGRHAHTRFQQATLEFPVLPSICNSSNFPHVSQRNDGRISKTRNTRHYARPLSRNDFEIAIICALKPEYEAVELLVDHFWDDDEEGESYRRAPGDENTYRNARIGEHNVVLMLLPGIGKVYAAKASASLRSSYRRLRLTLLVGICGGVPKYGEGTEILLGDVIISRSIVQYDLGRRFPNEFRLRGNIFETTNADIRAFLSTVETYRNFERLRSRTSHYLKILQENCGKDRMKYGYPVLSEDKLFDPSSRHKHHSSLNCDTCNKCSEVSDPVCNEALEMLCSQLQCDEHRIVPRQRLKLKELQATLSKQTDGLQQPVMHFGRMASGDTVMKSGIDRDSIARDYSVIAFEMEGAGVWDSLPCIIVKGVCDYADCHKNKKWQNLAAATAASVMKALLEQYTGTDIYC
ncbi:hypothetical protein H072_8812 [Dactylellina haptotyla CBS 200.50]|uniref:Uncharacterized protein n=1 Tax=Dactylellina haptotyla (strain CBS 200.50) TaxID=1284197 RepID=S8A3B6_DACHA|nr:hypothetical protein H072_8812 [Dactylellina haptotyla CBS 200.50]